MPPVASAPAGCITSEPAQTATNPASGPSSVSAQVKSFSPDGVAANYLSITFAKPAGTSVAFIAVDGQPARSIKVGEAIDGTWILREVTGRGAVLAMANGGAVMVNYNCGFLDADYAKSTPF